MLIIVRKDQSKIVMGLLSYSPNLADIVAVQREYDWYQSDDSRDILLWRDENTHRGCECLQFSCDSADCV